MRGSKYELKFYFNGTPTNEDEIRKVVQRMRTLKSKSEYIQDAKERNYKIWMHYEINWNSDPNALIKPSYKTNSRSIYTAPIFILIRIKKYTVESPKVRLRFLNRIVSVFRKLDKNLFELLNNLQNTQLPFISMLHIV